MSTYVKIEAVTIDASGALVSILSDRDYSLTPGQLIAYHLRAHYALPEGVTFDWVIGYDPVGSAIRQRRGTGRRLSGEEIAQLEGRPPSAADCYRPAKVLESVEWLLQLVRSGALPTQVLDFGISACESEPPDWAATANRVEEDLQKFVQVARQANEREALFFTRTFA